MKGKISMAQEKEARQLTNDQLPIDLGDGLMMRWGIPEDAEELGKFNVEIHSDNPDEPETWLADWTSDLMSGKHPTTQASDFTIVVDQNAGNKIVSSLNLISQTWTFAGIPFGVGRVELVGTHPEYRRRGLIRKQMDTIHRLSASRQELVQSITGIPWYYRQFGYEMTINLGGSRVFSWARPDNNKPQEEERFQIRSAEKSDIPHLQALYPTHCGNSLIVCQRSPDIWEYEMFTATRDTAGGRTIHMIEDQNGEIVAYAHAFVHKNEYRLREFGVKTGHSWREIALFLARELKKRADKLNEEREKPLTSIVLNLGDKHLVYDALGRQLDKGMPPYAWYIRVDDLPRFLEVVKPELERRLAESVMAGYSGMLRLNLYRSGWKLTFEQGRLQSIESYKADAFFKSDAVFPELTFLQLLFGYRSFGELDAAFADCFALNPEAAVLLDCLFPRWPSDINPLS